jgi:hypothetical protein
MQLRVLHIHSMIDFEIVTIDEARWSLEARARDPFHHVGNSSNPLEPASFEIVHLEVCLPRNAKPRPDIARENGQRWLVDE